MPLIIPGVISGGLFAFITSFDEVVAVLFLASPEQRTIPRQMWSGIREQISPINQYNYNGKQTQANASTNRTNDSKPTSITSTHTHMNHYCSRRSSYIASLIIENLD